MEQKNTRHNEDRLLAPFHGPALKAMRQTMGYTQEAFAAASGIGSRAFVNRLERPDAKPDRDTILRIIHRVVHSSHLSGIGHQARQSPLQ